jgi:hypothetical protein
MPNIQTVLQETILKVQFTQHVGRKKCSTTTNKINKRLRQTVFFTGNVVGAMSSFYLTNLTRNERIKACL